MGDSCNHVFDAVVPHGRKPTSTNLMSTSRLAQIYKVCHHLLQFAQETFPDLQEESNLFTRLHPQSDNIS